MRCFLVNKRLSNSTTFADKIKIEGYQIQWSTDVQIECLYTLMKYRRAEILILIFKKSFNHNPCKNKQNQPDDDAGGQLPITKGNRPHYNPIIR